MSPTTKHNNSKPSTVSASVTKKVKVKKAAPKASTVTITTNGEVIVQHILQGSYVHDSDHANRIIIKLSLATTHTMHTL